MTREERRSYWLTLVDKQAESGMSAAAFCKEHQIKTQQFYSWRRRLNPNRIDGTHGGFIQLISASKSKESGIWIFLDQAIAIEADRSFDPATMRAAVESLRSR